MAGDVISFGQKTSLGRAFYLDVPTTANTNVMAASAQVKYGNTDPAIVNTYVSLSSAATVFLKRTVGTISTYEAFNGGSQMSASTGYWLTVPATDGEYLNMICSATGFKITYYMFQTDEEGFT